LPNQSLFFSFLSMLVLGGATVPAGFLRNLPISLEARIITPPRNSAWLFLLALKTKEMYNFQKAKLEREQAAQQERMNAAMKESLFKPEVFRAHKKDLKEAEEKRKRMSVDIRAKIRTESKIGMARIESVRLQEEEAVIDERYKRSIAIQQARSIKAAARRKSLVFRNGDARSIRELHAQIQLRRQVELHQSYELKWAGEKDAEEYKKRCEQERRESFAFCNQEGKKNRDVEEGGRERCRGVPETLRTGKTGKRCVPKPRREETS
jgi:hypothetical protein